MNFFRRILLEFLNHLYKLVKRVRINFNSELLKKMGICCNIFLRRQLTSQRDENYGLNGTGFFR